jgi:putative transcriptional regulator
VIKLITKIAEYRNEAQMSQEQLADLVGVRRETIGRLEKGLYNPSLKLAMDIAKVFEVSVEQVFTFVSEKE